MLSPVQSFMCMALATCLALPCLAFQFLLMCSLLLLFILALPYFAAVSTLPSSFVNNLIPADVPVCVNACCSY